MYEKGQVGNASQSKTSPHVVGASRPSLREDLSVVLSIPSFDVLAWHFHPLLTTTSLLTTYISASKSSLRALRCDRATYMQFSCGKGLLLPTDVLGKE